ncbi:hypothetical protein [Streptosporangium longisporum]|uniref:DUF397 domain-containing protein n=1 Tax=Streptosporangium longisporum TaxID=46187 RepID=A0ABN3XRI5_9ACTN
MRVIVSLTRDGVMISAPGQRGVLVGFDAWEAFLRRAKNGWFDPGPREAESPRGTGFPRPENRPGVSSRAFPKSTA